MGCGNLEKKEAREGQRGNVEGKWRVVLSWAGFWVLPLVDT
jgi:hypothetical protein